MQHRVSEFSWGEKFTFPLCPKRSDKERLKGITMVLDKGMGLEEVKGCIEVGGDYIDFWKLGFGTAALYSPKLLQEKLRCLQEASINIYPGGTFAEVAILQGWFDLYLEKIGQLGFSTVEISDGSIFLSPWQRSRAINKAREMEFLVLTEVGKKKNKGVFRPEVMADQVKRDLKDGAFKVIMEARESGTDITVFDSEGNLQHSLVKRFLEPMGGEVRDIIWEAPLKKQQVEFITAFGPEVNLGNISPREILALESLRRGLRADTFVLSCERDSKETEMAEKLKSPEEKRV